MSAARPRSARRAGELALALLLATAGRAVAEPVRMQVIEVAGELAYLEPGAGAGLTPGTIVVIAGRELTVVEVTAATVAVRTEGAAIAVGATGTATVGARAADAPLATTLPPVRPAETWVAQWPDVTVPAAGQQPARRPLGGGRPGRVAAAVVIRGVGHATDDGEVTAALDARAAVRAEAWPAHDLWAELDVSGRGFTGGSTGPRAPIVIHAAQLRLGPSDAPRLQAGRLPWIGDQLGALDGVHARHRIGGVTVGGFAGLVPGDLDAGPRTAAARFGAELAWEASNSRWQPRLGLVAVGSTWDGTLDERRLLLDGEVARGALRARGWGEAQAFAAANPWAAAAVEVTAAGVSAGWWRRGRHVELAATFQRPDRSLRLAATTPLDWLCQGASIGGESGCTGASWTDVAASGGVTGGRWSIDGGGDVGIERLGDTFVAATGFVHGELRALPGGVRVQLGGAGGRARFVDWYGAELGLARGGRRWDVALGWRPELIAYTGALDRLWQHGLIVDGRWAVSARLALAASVLATAGGDRNAITAVTTLAWRPLP